MSWKGSLKSIGAIAAGFVTVGLLSALTDTVLEQTGIFTPPNEGLFTLWMIGLAILYRSAYSVLGGYLTAQLAPGRPMRHAVILGALGTLVSAVSAVAVIPQQLSPAWFPIALVVLALPSAWLGGKLCKANQELTQGQGA